jgi:hypothetical protein
MTIATLFQNAVESLSPSDRLRLATMLLETLSPSALDDSEDWSDDDLRDYAVHAQRRLAARMGEEEAGNGEGG